MFSLKQTKLILLTAAAMLLIMNCRAPVKPSEEDLTEYGWDIYEEGDYEEAREWFRDAIKKDPSFADGYNGLGWCFGKMYQADSAVHYFSIADSLEYDEYTTPYLTLDVSAGLRLRIMGSGKTPWYGNMQIISLATKTWLKKIPGNSVMIRKSTTRMFDL